MNAFKHRMSRVLAQLLAVVMIFSVTTTTYGYVPTAAEEVQVQTAVTPASEISSSDYGSISHNPGDNTDNEIVVRSGSGISALSTGTRIDLLTFADLHGHVDSLMNDLDPGAARLVAYTEWMRRQNPNPDNVMILPGGDEFHGHPLSNYLTGAPTVAMMNYLGVEHIALGNHEFSFGGPPPFMDDLDGIFLSADLYYAAGTPNAGTQPSFVQPYAVIEFEDGDIKVGLIGLMTSGMAHLVTGAFMSSYELRTPTLANPDPAWVNRIDYLIDRLRDHYDVDAVVALTHMYTNALNHATAPGGETGRLAAMFDFDAIIGGHTHLRHNFVQHGTLIMEAGWHGRTLGRISLYFDGNNDLDEVTGWLSPLAPAFPAANTESVRDFFRPAGYTFDGNPIPAAQHPGFDSVRNHFDAFSAIMQGYIDEGELYLGRNIGTRSIYSQTRNDRNVWVTRLVSDYVQRAEARSGGWSVPHWSSDESSWVYVSNFGGWRNVGPFTFTPQTGVTIREMYSTMPFNNAILLYEMLGEDLLVLLSMQASANASLSPPWFGLNGGQPPVIDGAFTRGQQIDDLTIQIGISNNNADGYREVPVLQWYLTATGEPIRNDNTVYRVIGSNFTQGAASALLPGASPVGGGDRFPIPGTTHGDARGFTFLGMPMSLMSDGSLRPYNEMPLDATTWEGDGFRTLRSAMIAQQEWRGENPGYTQRLTVSATDGGTAAITSPFAPGNRNTNVNVVPQHVVVTATSEGSYEFIGWFDNNVLVSVDEEYSFVQRGALTLEARFELPQLAAPVISIVGNNLTWALISDAIGYRVYVYSGDAVVPTPLPNNITGTSVDVSAFALDNGVHAFRVRAIADERYARDSVLSNGVSFMLGYPGEGEIWFVPEDDELPEPKFADEGATVTFSTQIIFNPEEVSPLATASGIGSAPAAPTEDDDMDEGQDNQGEPEEPGEPNEPDEQEEPGEPGYEPSEPSDPDLDDEEFRHILFNEDALYLIIQGYDEDEPVIEVAWFKDGIEIPGTRELLIGEPAYEIGESIYRVLAELTLNNVQPGDSGVYSLGARLPGYADEPWEYAPGFMSFTLTIGVDTSLLLSSLGVTGHTLNPAFNPLILNYTVTVPNNVESVTVTAISENLRASVIGTGSRNLAVGENRVDVVVEMGEESQTYTIRITRLATGATLPQAHAPTPPTARHGQRIASPQMGLRSAGIVIADLRANASNDITAESVLSDIRAVLPSGVTAAWSPNTPFALVPATDTTEGVITGIIIITYGQTRSAIVLNITIPSLEVDDVEENIAS
ncbi:MAG: cadherin-like beta sandwich domain-containing protein [Defluviitaleaceae bacterium]|nr:cadherin-like beta sandwich domain-containing protein [Defluviitaleaceae bacterium]